jgi:hypothetical protein
MNRWRLLFAGIILTTTLCACAAQQTTMSTAADSSPQAAMRAAIKTTELPCSEVSNSEAVRVRYPGVTLYRGGSALPKAEGLACLEVLADWLKGVSYKQWQVTVSGEAGYGFDPLALAGKRQQLLQRFFTRKGVDLQKWQWQAVADEGTQLQFAEKFEATGSP